FAGSIGRPGKASCWSSRTHSGRSSSPTARTCSNSDGSRWKARPNAFSPARHCRPPISAPAAHATGAAPHPRFRATIEPDHTEEKHHENQINGRHPGGGAGGAVGRERGLAGPSAWLSAVGRGGVCDILV